MGVNDYTYVDFNPESRTTTDSTMTITTSGGTTGTYVIGADTASTREDWSTSRIEMEEYVRAQELQNERQRRQLGEYTWRPTVRSGMKKVGRVVGMEDYEEFEKYKQLMEIQKQLIPIKEGKFIPGIDIIW